MRTKAWITLTKYSNLKPVDLYIEDIVNISEGFEVVQGITCQFSDIEVDMEFAGEKTIRVVESPKEIGKRMVHALMKGNDVEAKEEVRG